MRAANATVPEVQGFVDLDTFKSTYLYKGPQVFRGAATKEHGFDLECITGTGRPLEEEMARRMGDKTFRVFKDTYDDGSASFMNIKQYEELARKAEENSSLPLPYPRAVAQSALGECRPVPEEKIEQYHGMFSSAFMLPKGGKALVFYSMNKGTTTQMHMDVGDSLFTQVYGRKKWIFIDPDYVTSLQSHGASLNLFYASGYDVHLEAVPPEVPFKETTLYPGDVLYFPAMTFHAISNLDDVTLGIDQASFDVGGALRRHWLCTICSLFNPWTIIKVIKQFIVTGKINGHEVYFDDDSFSANKRNT